MRCLIAATLIAIASVLPAAAALGSADQNPDIARLVGFMTGSFSSEEQAKADPDNFRDIRLHMVPIWTSRDDGPWLYVEQAAGAMLDKPYRQRVYRLGSGAQAGTIESKVFELPGDPLVHAGMWKDPSHFDRVTPEELVERPGCTIVLRVESDAFVGATRDKECISTLRGAAYATSEATIKADGMVTWDRGYDAAGKQVWGAEKGGYHFVKQK
jgi:CpeT protein